MSTEVNATVTLCFDASLLYQYQES